MTGLPQLPNSLQGTQLPATPTVPNVTSTAPVVAAPLPLVPNSALVQNGQSMQQISSKQNLTDNPKFAKWLTENLDSLQRHQNNSDFAKFLTDNFGNLDDTKLKITKEICGGNNNQDHSALVKPLTEELREFPLKEVQSIANHDSLQGHDSLQQRYQDNFDFAKYLIVKIGGADFIIYR